MLNKITMNLSDEELSLVRQLRKSLELSTNTGTIVNALKITDFIVKGIKENKQVGFLDKYGRVESILVVPSIS